MEKPSQKFFLSRFIPTMAIMSSFGPYRFPKSANSHTTQVLETSAILRSHWQ